MKVFKFSYGLILKFFVLKHSFYDSLSMVEVATFPTHNFLMRNPCQIEIFWHLLYF